jgi:hypothetical protein
MIKIKDIVGLPSLTYHVENGLSLSENVYRYSSESFIQLFSEAKSAWRDGLIELNEDDVDLLESTDIGEYGVFEGEKVPLDLPMLNEEEIEEAKQDIYDKFLDNPSSPKGRAKSLILKFTKEYGDDASSMAVDRFAKQNNLKPEEKYILKYITKNDIKISSQSGGPDFSALSEAEYQGKEVPLNKPKRGGPKKFFVYVKNPKTGKIKKVNFGGTTGLNVKIDEPGARASFAARHQCDTKKDKTKPGYWACNIGRYWKSLGGSKNFSGYW